MINTVKRFYARNIKPVIDVVKKVNAWRDRFEAESFQNEVDSYFDTERTTAATIRACFRNWKAILVTAILVCLPTATVFIRAALDILFLPGSFEGETEVGWVLCKLSWGSWVGSAFGLTWLNEYYGDLAIASVAIAFGWEYGLLGPHGTGPPWQFQLLGG